MNGYCWICLLGFCLLAQSLWAQTQDIRSPFGLRVRISTADGRLFEGRLLYRDSTDLYFRSREEKRKVRIQRAQVRQVDTLGLWAPNRGQYFSVLGPATGYGLRQGEVYWRNYLLSTNLVAVGVTDYFSLGLGLDVLSTLYAIGEEEATYAFAPKFNYPIADQQLNLGAGALFANVAGFEGGLFTHHFYYTALTVGPRHRHVTAGLGLFQGEGDRQPAPVYMLSTHWQTGTFFALQLELLAGAPVEGLAVMPGLQLTGRRMDFNVSWPLVNTNQGTFPSPVPVAGFGVKFY